VPKCKAAAIEKAIRHLWNAVLPAELVIPKIEVVELRTSERGYCRAAPRKGIREHHSAYVLQSTI
jgi:hypothetical protein